MKISATTQRVVFLVLLAGIFVWLLCSIFHPFEPRYQGKRLSTWVNDLNPSDDEWVSGTGNEKHQKAVEAIRHFGIQAVPLAVKLCRTEDSKFKEKLIDWSDDWSRKHENYQIHITGEESAHHYQNRQIFEILGATGTPAIPSLIKLLGDHDPDVAGTAGSDLSYVGSDAVPPLIEALTNQNAQTRFIAAGALGGLGESFRPVTKINGTNGGVGYTMGAMPERFKPQLLPVFPALLQCLKDEDRRVRSAAAIALIQCDADPASAVPALIVALKKETNNSATGIFYALRHYGTNARPAVPFLIKIIQSQQKQSKPLWLLNPALNALRKIDPEAAKPFFDQWETSLTNADTSTKALDLNPP